jgi:NADP-dependent 3-hydroxy acid dehydrogenase YdfG
VAGLKAYPGGAVYGGTKWFVKDFMEVLRMEAAQEGSNIRATTIYPAAINTELLSTISHRGVSEAMTGIYKPMASRLNASRASSASQSISRKTPS